MVTNNTSFDAPLSPESNNAFGEEDEFLDEVGLDDLCEGLESMQD